MGGKALHGFEWSREVGKSKAWEARELGGE
jgi:hypothetical protein